MRQTIRAIGLATKILWIFTLLLPATIILSLSKLLEPNAIGVREPITSFHDGTFTMSSPFHINNTGFYDLSNVNVTMIVRSSNQTISLFSTVLPKVPAGKAVESNYTISFSLEEILSKNTTLLSNDTDLDIETSASFQIAYAITLGASTNTTTHWGAPFYNLTVSEVTYDPEKQKLALYLSFENHAYYVISGRLLAKIYNNKGDDIGFAEKDVNAALGQSFQTSFELSVDPSEITTNGFIRLYFEDMEIFEKEWS